MADQSLDSTNSQSQSRWKKLRTEVKGGLSGAAPSLSAGGQALMERGASGTIEPVKYKRGGKVRRTGLAIVHKGERVIPKGKVKRVTKMMRKSGMRMKARKR